MDVFLHKLAARALGWPHMPHSSSRCRRKRQIAFEVAGTDALQPVSGIVGMLNDALKILSRSNSGEFLDHAVLQIQQ